MTDRGPPAQQAQFVETARGARLVMSTGPADRAALGTVLAVPAFAEEMNKSRRMCAVMSRRLATQGWQVIQPDLGGCGDSAGEFRDARWSDWIDDLDDVLSARAVAGPLWLWGVRAGSLLCCELLARHPHAGLIFWQGTPSGAMMLQQFLRLHAGARIAGTDKPDPSNRTPAQRLDAGETVELGGYELSPELAAALKSARLGLPEGQRVRVVWLDVATGEPPEPSVATQRQVQAWRDSGHEVRLQVVGGSQYWQTQEIEDNPALIEATAEAVGSP